MSKYVSRKFVVALLVMAVVSYAPIAYKHAGVDDTVVLAVLAIIGGVGVAYKVVQGKIDAKKEEHGG